MIKYYRIIPLVDFEQQPLELRYQNTFQNTKQTLPE